MAMSMSRTSSTSLWAMAALAWLTMCGNIVRVFAFQSPHLTREDDLTPTTLAGYYVHADYHEAHRLLQTDDSTNTTTTETTTTTSQTGLLKDTCMYFLTVFAALFVVFLLVRPRYPRVYNFKRSFTAFHIPAAEDSFGRLDWMYKVFTISYEDIRDQCGMDAMTTIRILESGVKLSVVGILNSFFLFPVYSLMGEGNYSFDPIYTLSLSNLGEGNSGTIATTIAAYTLFGTAMHLMVQDLDWFTAHRHKFLSKQCAQNYTVFLSGLPPDFQTNEAIRKFFQKCFSHDAVAEVHVARNISGLETLVTKRNSLVPKLEHAINVVKVKNQKPMHKTKVCGGEKVESVPTYSAEIVELNNEIKARRECIDSMRMEEEESLLVNADVENGEGSSKIVKKTSSLLDKFKFDRDDGSSRNAAFVTFSDLTSANIARQTLHHPEPWSLVPAEPPISDLVNWKNVGKSNKTKHFGELMSFVFTALLCIFWTIPVSFVASLSNVEALTELLPFLKEPVEKYKAFSMILGLLAPLLLVVFTSLLPKILLSFVKFECLIEIETMLHPSLFSKLATFTILQTFFISTIASTLFSSLDAILKDPTSSIKLLSEALPPRAAFFIQLIIAQNLLPLGSELLRITPVVKNQIRQLLANALGHNLTVKERGETFMGLQALGDPPQYEIGSEVGSKIVLLLMVLYVYSCMSPITSYFTLLVFGFLAIGLRNQFIFIYPVSNDSGGKMWINFQRVSMTCIIVAEIILLVLLMSKKSPVAVIMMLPLVIATILFRVYFNRRHYSVTRFLPMSKCSEIDAKSETERVSDASFKDAYLQPALIGGSAFLENYMEVTTWFSEQKENKVEDGGDVEDLVKQGVWQQFSTGRVLEKDDASLIVGDSGFEFQLSDSFDGSEHKKKHSDRQHKERPGEEGHRSRKGSDRGHGRKKKHRDRNHQEGLGEGVHKNPDDEAGRIQKHRSRHHKKRPVSVDPNCSEKRQQN